jgi:hypothetical protein
MVAACARDGDRFMLEGVSVFALIIVAFIAVTALMGVRQVPQGHRRLHRRDGADGRAAGAAGL